MDPRYEKNSAAGLIGVSRDFSANAESCTNRLAAKTQRDERIHTPLVPWVGGAQIKRATVRRFKIGVFAGVKDAAEPL